MNGKQKNKILLIICIAFLLIPKFKNMIIITRYYGFYLESFIPEVNVVPDEETAKKIAEDVWVKAYGEEVKSEKPYKVKYDKIGMVWVVEGTLPKDMLGGTAGVIIRKSDGKVLKSWHFK